MADPLKIVTDVLRESIGAFAHEEANAVLYALKEAGFMLVPVEVSKAPDRIRWEDLKPGMVVRMRRSGVRRIEAIDPNRHGPDQQWSRVRWVRLDEGRYQGKTGHQTAAYFAREVTEVLSNG